MKAKHTQYVFALCFVLTTGFCRLSQASDVQLLFNVDTQTQSWFVSGAISDNQSLGIASFQIDVTGSGGFTVQRAFVPGQTNQAATPPFGLFRTSGSIATGPKAIGASQDTITAANDQDNSGLGFGYGDTTNVVGSAIGPVTARGPAILAAGRYTGFSGQLTASLTAGSFFNLFPLNFSAAGEPGSSKNTVPAQVVTSASFPFLVNPDPRVIVPSSQTVGEMFGLTSFTVSPTSPTASSPLTVTMSGVSPTGFIPTNAYLTSPESNAFLVSLLTSQTTGGAAGTPWTLQTTLGPLAAGSYDFSAKGIEGIGSNNAIGSAVSTQLTGFVVVPEPSSFASLAFGVLLLASSARRRGKSD